MKVKRSKTARFIFEANRIHGDKYNYSLVKFLTSTKAVSIICPKHGVFMQTPSSHLTGAGCKYCGYGRLTREEFLVKANAIHNSKYDYSHCEYSQDSKKITLLRIICPQHGEFFQRLDLHLNGHGCPKCLKGRGIEYFSI